MTPKLIKDVNIAERLIFIFANIFISSIDFLTFNTIPNRKKMVTIH